MSAKLNRSSRWHNGFEQFSVLGIPITATSLAAATSAIIGLAKDRQPHMVFVREVASLMAAVDDDHLASLHFKASLVVPDGTPLVWVGKLKGFSQSIGRVAGADLVDAVCEASLSTGQSHFFFGGGAGVAEEMVGRLLEKYPGLKISGTLTPPVRAVDSRFLMQGEAKKEAETIRDLHPDFIWVGLSSPKQEFWMEKAVNIFDRGVFLGVGAAFDFHSGRVKRAPNWMANNGMEWFHRLLSEPRRLWRRYLILCPRFVLMLVKDTVKLSNTKGNKS